MEKKVYVIFKSSKGVKDVVCITETEEHAKYWIQEAYRVYEGCGWTFNFRAYPFVIDEWYNELPKFI